jgi:serine/threonine protein kinase
MALRCHFDSTGTYWQQSSVAKSARDQRTIILAPSPQSLKLPVSDSAAKKRPPSANADLSSRQLGDFQLLRRLGRGAMAEVYLAEQGSLKRQVAVKVLKPELAADETYVQRFHNEAQAAASLVHANIVQIYGVGCVEGIHYIAQEYVQGQNLHEFMTRRGPPDLKLAVAVMRQVASALQKAAERGIVHRDIKPENIMLARTGEVKVADFGLARLTGDGAGGVHLTQVGITMGTPLYMSPEQVEGRTLDPRSDLYSFGVTCFHMLAGSPPFVGDTALAVAVQHLKTQPDRLENIRPDLPPALCRIVHKMLAKTPKDRYATPRELLHELRALQIEGVDGDWGEESGAWEAAELDSLTARLAATQQLGQLMKTSALRTSRPRRTILLLLSSLAGAFLLGGGLAWLTRERPLLSDAQHPHVPKQNTVEEQLFFARMRGTEPWLLSVSAYYPQEKHHVRLAQQELARLYLRQGRLTEALKICDEFSALGEDQAAFRAFGLAGRAVVLTNQKRYPEASEALAALWPLREKLEAPMWTLIQNIVQANQKAMNRQVAEEWTKWLQSRPPAEE